MPIATAVFTLSAAYAHAQEFTAKLSGFNELGSLPSATASPTGAILSDGTGTAKLDLDRKAGTITYTLTYSNVGATPPLTGTVTQAHIHFGKSRDSGGILVFFCTNLGNGPAGVVTPACPPNSGTVTGTWTKANVVAIAGQNVSAMDFDALTDALACDAFRRRQKSNQESDLSRVDETADAYRRAEPCLCGRIDCPPGARRTGVDRYDINALRTEFVSQVLRERGCHLIALGEPRIGGWSLGLRLAAGETA